MTEIVVRQATLADTFAITDIYCSNIEGGVFTRWNVDGTRTPVAYETLGLFERYLNGGPWMSVETCAVWLAHLLRYGDEIPLVAEADGLVLGEAEVIIGNEPSPYGRHLSIATLKVHHDATDQQQLANALINYVKEMAQVMQIQQVLVTNPEPIEWYRAHDFQPMAARRLVQLPAKEGRVVYKAVQMTNFAPDRIDGWGMPLGRWQSARHEWSRIWPGFWNCVPQLVEPEVDRFDIELTRQQAILLLEQNRHHPQRASVYLWTERSLSSHMISAVRDRAARHGYVELETWADDAALALVEGDATDVSDPHVLLAWRV